MWPPNDVVPKHRKRAHGVWIFLIVLFFGYMAYTVLSAMRMREHPPSVLTYKVGVPYVLPDLGFCFQNQAGCQFAHLKDCAATAAIRSFVEVIVGDKKETFDVVVDPAREGNCVISRISTTNLTAHAEPTLIHVILNWVPRQNSSIYVPFEHVAVVLHKPGASDAERAAAVTSTLMSYFYLKLNVTSQAGENFNDMSIRHTELIQLDGSSDRHYEVTTFDSVTNWKQTYPWVFSNSDSYTDTPRSLSLSTLSASSSFLANFWPGVAQTGFGVLDEIDEAVAQSEAVIHIPEWVWQQSVLVDPVNISTIMGAAAGFWGYLSIIFGVFFIAKNSDGPSLIMRRVAPVVALKRRRSSQQAMLQAEEDAMADPDSQPFGVPDDYGSPTSPAAIVRNQIDTVMSPLPQLSRLRTAAGSPNVRGPQSYLTSVV